MIGGALLLTAGCDGGQCLAPPDTLVYENAGGFVGLAVHAEIMPDGAFTASGALVGDKSGQLTAAQRSELGQRLADWCTLSYSSGPTPCCDINTYTFTYRGKTLSFNATSERVPPSLIALRDWIEDTVRDAP